jgi:hypothetical protein
MAETKDSGGLHRGTIVGAVVVVVVAALVVVLARGAGRSTPAAAGDQGGEGPAVVEHGGAGDRDDLEEHDKVVERNPQQKKRAAYTQDKLPIAVTKGRWNPSRPLRFVAKYGPDAGGRSEADARRLAEQVRQKVLHGEESWGLIRDLSDRPTGVPRDLVLQWAKLSPNEASPVLSIENGFVVFFGPPDEPPASYLSPPEKATGGNAD